MPEKQPKTQKPENVRKDYKDCPPLTADRFFAALLQNKDIKQKSHTPPTEKAHFDRHAYKCGKDKISAVYDQKAKILSLTASQVMLDKLDIIFVGSSNPAPVPLAPVGADVLGRPQPRSVPTPLKPPPPPAPKTLAGEKKLQKICPSSFKYLSDQSKTDLIIGLTDINNPHTQLSDYSVLLVPPFRALERLIYDLQTARGIEVKMIGQGFEKKDDGSYCIKSGYSKKINSIVYDEVLSALYTEYFTRRNFYAHSDNTDPTNSRSLKTKAESKQIFDSLIKTVEYNCKKLTEINFEIKPSCLNRHCEP